MAASFPTTIPSAGAAVTTQTLSAAGHTALHNDDRDNIRAIAQKLGTGSSTPTAGTFLTSTSNSTSTWTKAVPTGDVVGTSDTQTLTNKTLTSPTINTPTGIVKGDVGLGNVDNTSDATKNSASATLTNKTINADNNTISNIGNSNFGTDTGDINGAWSTWTYNEAGIGSNYTFTGKYTQIGKTVFGWVQADFSGAPSSFTNVTFDLPVTAAQRHYTMGDSVLVRSLTYLFTMQMQDTTTAIIRKKEHDKGVSTDAIAAAGFSPTNPATVQSGDVLYGWFVYQAA